MPPPIVIEKRKPKRIPVANPMPMPVHALSRGQQKPSWLLWFTAGLIGLTFVLQVAEHIYTREDQKRAAQEEYTESVELQQAQMKRDQKPQQNTDNAGTT